MPARAAPVQKEGAPVFSKEDEEKLKRHIRELTLLLEPKVGFKLASGRTSHFLFNVKNLFGEPEPAALVTRKLLSVLRPLEFDYIAGVELGAVFPVTTAVLMSRESGRDIRGFVVRKKPKEHGSKNRIEGQRVPPKSGLVLVIEDVTTTGGSLLEAIEAVREQGCTVRQAVTIIDREEGAADALRAMGIELIPLYRKRDFLDANIS